MVVGRLVLWLSGYPGYANNWTASGLAMPHLCLSFFHEVRISFHLYYEAFFFFPSKGSKRAKNGEGEGMKTRQLTKISAHTTARETPSELLATVVSASPAPGTGTNTFVPFPKLPVL